MIHNYKILTLTHKHTPLHELGQFVLTNKSEQNDKTQLQSRLQTIQQQLGLDELFYVATCNRVFFFFTTEQSIDGAWVAQFIKKVYTQLPDSVLEIGIRTAQYFEGRAAINHLFEVASSIDSLVVGEREILRQLRTAYEEILPLGTTGDSIRLAMRFMVEAAKKVYSNTKIGEKPVSIVSLAMQQLFSHKIPRNARYLIVGAGQTNQLVAKFLLKQEVRQVAVFNRTLGKAENLAQSLDGQGYTLSEMSNYSQGFDVLIACTSATEPIISSELYEHLLQGDTTRKVVVDLAVPNNVDAQIVENFNVDYIEIEHLKALAKENLAFREQEVTQAQTILNQEVEVFEQAFQTRKIERAFSGVPTQIKAVKDHAMNNVFRNEIAQLDDNSRAVLEKVMQYMEKRCIAIPIQVAKESLANLKM